MFNKLNNDQVVSDDSVNNSNTDENMAKNTEGYKEQSVVNDQPAMGDDSVNNSNTDEKVGTNSDSCEEQSVLNDRPAKELPQKVGINFYYNTHLCFRGEIETSTSI